MRLYYYWNGILTHSKPDNVAGITWGIVLPEIQLQKRDYNYDELHILCSCYNVTHISRHHEIKVRHRSTSSHDRDTLLY